MASDELRIGSKVLLMEVISKLLKDTELQLFSLNNNFNQKEKTDFSATPFLQESVSCLMNIKVA